MSALSAIAVLRSQCPMSAIDAYKRRWCLALARRMVVETGINGIWFVTSSGRHSLPRLPLFWYTRNADAEVPRFLGENSSVLSGQVEAR